MIENPEDYEELTEHENKNEPVTLAGREGKFQEVDTIHKKYSERPDALKDMCLAQFATSYTYQANPPMTTDFLSYHPEQNQLKTALSTCMGLCVCP